MNKKILIVLTLGIVLIVGLLFAANQTTHQPYKIDTVPTTLTEFRIISCVVWENAQAGDTIVLQHKTRNGGTLTELINTTAKAAGTSIVPLSYPLRSFDFTVATLTHGNLRIYFE